MGHAAGELPDAFQPLRLPQLFFQPPAIRNVDVHADQARGRS
jgi:hypothetical protein